MKKLLFAVAVLLASPAAAQWQTPTYSVPIGRGAGNTGFDNAAPGVAGVPVVSNGATAKPTFAPVQNVGIAPGAANTMKGTLNGTTTSDIALTACTLTYQITKWAAGSGWQCGLNPVLPSRAIAATLDLSAFTAVRTLGYATAGDGGGATFSNVTSTQFLDSHITAGSITSPGAGCTNGTYYRTAVTGGTGTGFYANVTAAGNVVTVVQVAENGGSGFTVGNVLTGSITGCTFTWTVSAVSTPLASFTDLAGNHLQYVVDNYINARQFGVKADRTTDDQPSIQAALKFAGRQNYTVAANGCEGGAGSCGSTVILPAGTMVLQSALTVYKTVELRGQGEFASALLLGAGFPVASDGVYLCDNNVQLACFGPRVSNLSITSPASLTANNSTYLVSSISAQQTVALEHVALYALDQRGCLKYTHGYGGAAKVHFFDVFCTISSANTSDGIVINPTTTVNTVFDGGLIVEAGGGGYAGNAVNWQSGNLFINGFHTEGIATGVFAANATATHQGSLSGATGGSLCTELVKLDATNTLGNLAIGTSQINGCTRLITNGQPGGANFAGNTVKQITCNPGAPCN